MSDTTAYDPVLLAVATAKAAEQERAATEALIVAYLRETCIGAVRVGSPEAIAAGIIAERISAIERGEHRKP